MTKKTDETSGHFAQSGMEAPAKDAPKPSKAKADETEDSPLVKINAGMEPGMSPKERRAELNKQFEEADEKGKAAIIDETQAGLGVRGF